MSTALLTEIFAGVPIVAAAIVSVIIAIKANNKSTATASALEAHTNAHSS
jgi:hypothetical protein